MMQALVKLYPYYEFFDRERSRARLERFANHHQTLLAPVLGPIAVA